MSLVKEKVQTIELSKIKNVFDVRVQLDEDRVLQFMGMYESGENVPPVRLVELDENEYAYIDGRHRGTARGYLDYKDVEAIVKPISDYERDELYSEALKSNWGGSKPPTREDISHTITRMLELGTTQARIMDLLTYIPKGSLKAYIVTAKGNINKRKIGKALQKITHEGLNVEEAAKQTGVSIKYLKETLDGKRSKFGNRKDVDPSVGVKAYISTQLKSCHTGISKKMYFLLEQVENGEASYEQVTKVIKFWKDYSKRTVLRVDDWQSRLDEKCKNQKNAKDVH